MAKRSISGEESVNHYGGVRMRVTGSGNLRMRLLSLSETRQNVLVPFNLNTTIDVEPFRLSNFTQQRAQLEFKMVAADEHFEISKIIIFVKPVASSLPGN